MEPPHGITAYVFEDATVGDPNATNEFCFRAKLLEPLLPDDPRPPVVLNEARVRALFPGGAVTYRGPWGESVKPVGSVELSYNSDDENNPFAEEVECSVEKGADGVFCLNFGGGPAPESREVTRAKMDTIVATSLARVTVPITSDWDPNGVLVRCEAGVTARMLLHALDIYWARPFNNAKKEDYWIGKSYSEARGDHTFFELHLTSISADQTCFVLKGTGS